MPETAFDPEPQVRPIIAAASANDVMREQLEDLIYCVESGTASHRQCARYDWIRGLLLEVFKKSKSKTVRSRSHAETALRQGSTLP